MTMPPATATKLSEPGKKLQQEIAGYVQEMQHLGSKELGEVLDWLSSISARVLEMIFFTLDNDNREMMRMRVERLQPLHEELRYQYTIASRKHSFTRFEWESSK